MADGANGNVQDVPPGYVPVDIIARDGDGKKLLEALLQAGLIKSGVSYGSVASGYVSSSVVDTISKMDNVVSAFPAHSTTRSSA